MKKTIFGIVMIGTIFACGGNNNPYPYMVRGYVNVNDTLRRAIAYTDTIYGYNRDSVWYYNSNGSKVTLLAPYSIMKVAKPVKKENGR